MSIPLVTWLYSPPTRSERVLRALDFKPDAVIYDLEDAVAPPEKGLARRNLAEGLEGLVQEQAPHLQVRINGVGTAWFDQDVALLHELPAIGSVRVPKVECARDVERVASILPEHLPVHALVETATGVERLSEICSAPRVMGVSLGEADLRAQLRGDDPLLMQHIRLRLVIASAAAGIAAPMGSAWLNIRDHKGLFDDTSALAKQGFLGRTAIHPSQLPHIRDAFRPSEIEYLDALRVLDASGWDSEGSLAGAATLSDGTFVDRPVIVRAHQTVALWDHLAGDNQ